MKLIVDKKSRLAKMRAHTAAHLLHSQLGKIINLSKQAGSLVDEDYLRFDFTTSKALDNSEILEIEKNINNIIKMGYDVEKREMSFNDAISLGAKAFFEDKYGDTVRVISIKNESENEIISIELCGGTHVNNTADIGSFKIVSQEAVASGIRRITAITGTKLLEYIYEKEQIIDIISNKLQSDNPKQVIEKLEKTLKDYNEVKSAYESAQTQMIGSALTSIKNGTNEDFEIILNLDENLSKLDFKLVLNKAREIFNGKTTLIYSNSGNFGIFSDKISAKQLGQKYGLKGGGSDILFQGKDENINKIK